MWQAVASSDDTPENPRVGGSIPSLAIEVSPPCIANRNEQLKRADESAATLELAFKEWYAGKSDQARAALTRSLKRFASATRGRLLNIT